MRKAAVFSVCVLVLAVGSGCNGPGRVPSFSLPGMLPLPLSAISLAGRDSQGNPISLEAYRGRVVLVDVWKSG